MGLIRPCCPRLIDSAFSPEVTPCLYDYCTVPILWSVPSVIGKSVSYLFCSRAKLKCPGQWVCILKVKILRMMGDSSLVRNTVAGAEDEASCESSSSGLGLRSFHSNGSSSFLASASQWWCICITRNWNYRHSEVRFLLSRKDRGA